MTLIILATVLVLIFMAVSYCIWATGKYDLEERYEKDIEVEISNQMADAYLKAWDALGRYKFYMFGYWASQWVLLNKLLPEPRPNPFKPFVKLAKEGPIP